MEIWNLKVKGTDLTSYTQHIQELALLCGRMFPEESDKIEKYVDGLPDMIHGSVVASKPKTMQEAVKIATELKDKKIHTFAERQTTNKRKQDDNYQQPQQQQNKRQNTGRAYTTESVGHLARDCRSTANANTTNNKGALGQVRNPLAMNVEPSDTSRGIVQSLKTTTAVTKLEMAMLQRNTKRSLCAEKIVRIPWGNETLIVRGDESNQGNKTRLNIISCTKTQKYLIKGCPIFLAHVIMKETEDKLKEKRLEDVPIVQDFPDVFGIRYSEKGQKRSQNRQNQARD
ncbi:hypothetical protein Tco_0348018 [Tanacetum coccineum]